MFHCDHWVVLQTESPFQEVAWITFTLSPRWQTNIFIFNRKLEAVVPCDSVTWNIICVCIFLFCLHSFQGKFSKEELDDLRTEFTHHKDKVKEYNRLLRVLTDHDDISENSVFSRSEIKEKELEKWRNKLQDTHESLTKNYARLKEKTTGEKEGTSLFRDRRVTELWQKAQNGKFTNEELESIKVKCWLLWKLDTKKFK